MKKTELPKDGPITKALDEAVVMRRQMLDAGSPADQVDYAIGQGLKALLGNKREEPWHFICPRCRDTGWSEVRPSAEEEARLMRLYGSTTEHQGYVVKCDPCRWNQKEREKRRLSSGNEHGDDDVSSAGHIKPRRGWKKFGGV